MILSAGVLRGDVEFNNRNKGAYQGRDCPAKIREEAGRGGGSTAKTMTAAIPHHFGVHCDCKV